jgi:hypothetical protein
MQKLIIEGLNPVEAQNKAYEGFNQPCDKGQISKGVKAYVYRTNH